MFTTAPGKRLQERARQQRHVAGEHDELDVALGEPVGDRGVARGAVGVVADREDGGLDARVARALAAPPRRRLVGRDADDERLVAVDGVQQRLQVRPRAGGEHADAQRLVRAATPPALRPPSRAGDRPPASLGYMPPVERRRPASSSSSTRAMTCLAVRWSNVPYAGRPSWPLFTSACERPPRRISTVARAADRRLGGLDDLDDRRVEVAGRDRRRARGALAGCSSPPGAAGTQDASQTSQHGTPVHRRRRAAVAEVAQDRRAPAGRRSRRTPTRRGTGSSARVCSRPPTCGRRRARGRRTAPRCARARGRARTARAASTPARARWPMTARTGSSFSRRVAVEQRRELVGAEVVAALGRAHLQAHARPSRSPRRTARRAG